jgi:hypothetical protein
MLSSLILQRAFSAVVGRIDESLLGAVFVSVTQSVD